MRKSFVVAVSLRDRIHSLDSWMRHLGTAHSVSTFGTVKLLLLLANELLKHDPEMLLFRLDALREARLFFSCSSPSIRRTHWRTTLKLLTGMFMQRVSAHVYAACFSTCSVSKSLTLFLAVLCVVLSFLTPVGRS